MSISKVALRYQQEALKMLSIGRNVAYEVDDSGDVLITDDGYGVVRIPEREFCLDKSKLRERRGTFGVLASDFGTRSFTDSYATRTGITHSSGRIEYLEFASENGIVCANKKYFGLFKGKDIKVFHRASNYQSYICIQQDGRCVCAIVAVKPESLYGTKKEAK
jgi:hypothetical protein